MYSVIFVREAADVFCNICERLQMYSEIIGALRLLCRQQQQHIL